MIVALLLLIPFITALALMFLRPTQQAKNVALISTLASLGVVLFAWSAYTGGTVTHYNMDWVPAWGLRFVMGYDGVEAVAPNPECIFVIRKVVRCQPFAMCRR